MDQRRLEQLLASVADGTITVEQALVELKSLPYEDLGVARPDLHRHLRQGTPECIFSQGKTPTQVVEIAESLLKSSPFILATRCDTATFDALRKRFQDVQYHSQARIASIGVHPAPNPAREQLTTAVVTAGTSDVPVAEESAVVLEHFGFTVNRIYDVGVAGLHRVLGEVRGLQSADAIIVIAGMDGVLPSVVGGLVACPVIAVPTSVGYGASFDGLAALLTMLNSCAHGITVVNIDNGFGAAMAVIRMLLKRADEQEDSNVPASTITAKP